MHNFILEDDYYNELQTYFVKQYKNIQAVVSNYISIMDEVAEHGIMDGKTAKALKEFNNQLRKELNVKTCVEKQGKIAKRYCSNFVDRVDKDDEGLY